MLAAVTRLVYVQRVKNGDRGRGYGVSLIADSGWVTLHDGQQALVETDGQQAFIAWETDIENEEFELIHQICIDHGYNVIENQYFDADWNRWCGFATREE